MSKPKIIQKLRKKHSYIGKKNLEKIFEIFFDKISESLIDKKSVEIRSLGTFFVKEIKEKSEQEIHEQERFCIFQNEIRLDLGLVKDLKN